MNALERYRSKQILIEKLAAVPVVTGLIQGAKAMAPRIIPAIKKAIPAARGAWRGAKSSFRGFGKGLRSGGKPDVAVTPLAKLQGRQGTKGARQLERFKRTGEPFAHPNAQRHERGYQLGNRLRSYLGPASRRVAGRAALGGALVYGASRQASRPKARDGESMSRMGDEQVAEVLKKPPAPSSRMGDDQIAEILRGPQQQPPAPARPAQRRPRPKPVQPAQPVVGRQPVRPGQRKYPVPLVKPRGSVPPTTGKPVTPKTTPMTSVATIPPKASPPPPKVIRRTHKFPSGGGLTPTR